MGCYQSFSCYFAQNPKQQKILASFDRGSQCISGDSAGNIWVGTWNGLYKISANREMTRYINSSDKGELSDNQIRCVLEDDFKHIWVGTFRGLDCYDPTIDNGSIIHVMVILQTP